MNNKGLGDLGEQLAAEYLQKKGMTVLAQQYRVRGGELDIVASDGDYIVFVEVKTRRSLSYGTPAQAVSRTKQQNIMQAARDFLYHQKLFSRPCRFDVIEVYYQADKTAKINHIINAFME